MPPPSLSDPAQPFLLAIDTGGTFTDCIARTPGGEVRRAKVLSSSSLRGTVTHRLGADRLLVRGEWAGIEGLCEGWPLRLPQRSDVVRTITRHTARAEEVAELRLDAPLPAGAPAPGETVEILSDDEAPVLAARIVTRTPAREPLPPMEMRLGTTRGTNALLQRTGPRGGVALFITEGFADLLAIGTQQRPDLFALDIRKQRQLHEHCVEVHERLNADGTVLKPLEIDAVRDAARALAARGVRSAAVALLHSDVNPAHEHAVRAALLEAGLTHVSCSCELAPFIKILPRAQTAVVNAFLAPVMEEYLGRIAASLGTRGSSLLVMSSSGGLLTASSFRPKDGLLSGPAGGVIGAAAAARRGGLARVITLDMGGTSADASRIDGRELDYVFEHAVGDARIAAPALLIETVAAGGGSICSVDPASGALCVGPRSAGAEPGPACYGRGGPLTITDCNLLLGRLDASRFAIPVDQSAAERAAEDVLRRFERAGGRAGNIFALLEGFLALANQRMAEAIRRISVREGYDPAEYALLAFGGAGPQHACAVARELGMQSIIIPADASLLSAAGLAAADIERIAERQLLRPLRHDAADVLAVLGELEEEAITMVLREAGEHARPVIRRRILQLRLEGQDSPLSVEWNGDEAIAALFAQRYRAVFAHNPPDGRAIEIVSARVIAACETPESARPDREATGAAAHPRTVRNVWLDGRPIEAGVYERSSLAPGALLHGPALVTEAHTTALVEDHWTARVDRAGALILEQRATRAKIASPRGAGTSAAGDELFAGRLTAIARDMGEQLRRTAISVNVKERLDFSCALLDAHGRLLVNAPHIPVHLGALGMCVRRVAETIELAPGDVAATNHPAFGGSHLPDITVITPVHDADGTLLGYAANRAHHAEIGGTAPGSMPPDARSLAEEGVVIPPVHLLRRDGAHWDAMERLFTAPPYPSRLPRENLADLRAQVAANQRGAELLLLLARDTGSEPLATRMRFLSRRAERLAREALGRSPDGIHACMETLDDGSEIAVRIEKRGQSARIDFSGTSGVHPGNLNATPGIVTSAVVYVLRLLIGARVPEAADEAIPLNEGLLAPVELVIPPGMLNPPMDADPTRCPAVAGGNVETSQRIVDALLRALGLCAASQGTMNNVLFGNERFGYYETVCGGAGAGPGFAGADAVHTHMTNTRITDPEVLERRYPVRLERFAVRRGSGGAGRFRGGDGTVREITFLEPAMLSLLTQRRARGAPGMEGGEAGAPGQQRILRADGRSEALGSVDGRRVSPGDRLVLQTPGGGGWGAREDSR